MVLTRDGIKLFYEQDGKGDPEILLVHGWTCDHTYMKPQFDHLSKSHRVVAVDLRGHGQSDKPDGEYTMSAFADDLASLCAQLGVTKPVVIGHSMGGVIALELAQRHPELPSAIVTLDSPIVSPAGTHEGFAPFIKALQTPAYREAQRETVSNFLFIPADDPKRKAQIVEAMSSAPQHVMASAFEMMFATDTDGSVSACKVPLLVLLAEQPLSDVNRLRQLAPNAIVRQTLGAGHFHQLEVPDQVNSMIDRFLAISL